MAEIQINSYKNIQGKIYTYTTPGVTYHENFLKIGYTERNVAERIDEQTKTADIIYKIEWIEIAPFDENASKIVKDTDFHRYLIEKYQIEQREDSEWFKISPALAHKYFLEFSAGFSKSKNILTQKNYNLHDEQINAVNQTLNYYKFSKIPKEFLWNAKPRFGKTLATYDFILQIDAQKVLIVTNRPSISNSWYDDFKNFVEWHGYKFVSTTDTLPNNLNYEDYYALHKGAPFVAFISLQDLKGSKFFGGNYDKLHWVQDLNFDLLVVDEAHEGIDTAKTSAAFANIKRNFTLYLSGTPFKALADNLFSAEQIFNWSYEDEQNAKINWNEDTAANPYADLPQMNLFSYQLSKMVADEVTAENSNYIFDLNEFFSTNGRGKFNHEDDIKKFLDALTTFEKFPFATPELRAELNHTFWILQRVDSAKALAKILQTHKIFSEYEIIIAAGDGRLNDDDKISDSYKKVKKAIATHAKTITLSVGQLTTGVTVPEWTAVLMLSEMQSATEYIQAAFRAQNPCTVKIGDKISRKENCYVFDFSPTRTLKIYNQFANSLGNGGGNSETVENLLKVFPVFAENDHGKMIQLDAENIMSMPQKLAAAQVVDCGFMSNTLFQNVFHVFNAPKVFENILNKINVYETSKTEIKISDTDKPKKKSATRKKNGVKQVDNPKTTTEYDIRSRLRSFARTIPSFLMAYGDENLTLANFETYIDDKTFEEVTGITKADFIFLRDGGERDGEIFNGGLFDEIIFNAAVKDFLNRKKNLADYLNSDKDIFDFIPPQKNSQIFTPRVTVQKMLDALQIQNPNIFDDPQQKFFDPYIKSGLYIAEIVKRLYHGKNIRAIFPRRSERLKHILENQVYGCAPTEIIYRIATNFIFGNFENISRRNFLKLDFSRVDDAAAVLKKIFSIGVIILDKDRVKKFGEVFTPNEIVNLMLDDENLADVFETLDKKILEPTAGKGAFLVEILKRKLKLAKNSADAFAALSSIFGIEIQNDNLNDAKQNLANAFTDFHLANFGEFSRLNLWQILDKHIVQGDALKLFGGSLFDDAFSDFDIGELKNIVVIGNPPYQTDIKGDNKTYAAPIYHNFLESFWRVSSRVMMIHPARCLFNAGATPKAFMQKLLNDDHLKVIYYEPRSQNIFPNADIKGGVAVTYHDKNKFFGKIEVFIPFKELYSIWRKVFHRKDFESLSKIIYSRTAYSLTKKLHQDFPNAKKRFSKGNEYQFSSNVFDLIPEIFFDKKPNDGKEYIQVWGLIKNNRVIKFVRRNYITDHETLEKYKVLLPDSNGSGMIGEVVSTPLVGLPLVGLPLVGSTQTFITLGAFDTEAEAQNALKFVKTKFARALLGVLKVTQHNPPATWKYVPLQDFTASSDIDWTLPVAEIDKKLYSKYDLTAEEINFIETNVREML